jgi:hypothetical protein
MSIESANYVQDFCYIFFKVEKHHAREICLREYYVHRKINGMEIC